MPATSGGALDWDRNTPLSGGRTFLEHLVWVLLSRPYCGIK
jgi:hypothetical protein